MSYDATVLSDLPLLYWPLNETTGTIANDLTGNGHIGTYTNGPTLAAGTLVAGETETSPNFVTHAGAQTTAASVIQNGTYTPATLDTFTLECVIQPSAAQISNGSIPSDPRNTAAPFSWNASPIGQIIGFQIFGTQSSMTNGSLLATAQGSIANTNQPPVLVLVAGQKYHLVFTYDFDTAQIWVNGQLLNEFSPVTIGPFTHAGKFSVGNSTFYGPFDGLIGRCAYYEYALTPERIAVHYQSFVGTNPADFVSTDDLITQTEDILLSGARDNLNFLSKGIAAGDTTIELAQPLSGESAGSYLGCELEVMYVKSVDATAQTALVRRGMLGSPVGAHANDSIVYVNPLFSKWEIFKALNIEITSMSGADNGLFAEKSFTVLSQPVQKTYDVPAANLDMRKILEIRYDAVGPERYWPLVRSRQTQVLRDLQTDTGTSGLSIRIEEDFIAGRRLVVRYAGDFLPLSMDLNDNAAATTLLTTNMIDIPAMGAAARLMGFSAARRTFVQRAVDSRRAQEVPAGAAAAATGAFLSLLNGRIKSEADRLRHLWPDSV